VTSLAEAAPKSSMRGRLVWVALALSLTLNVFFVAGLLWFQVAGQPMHTPAERIAATASELNLTAEQRDDFQQFVHEVQEHSRHLRESNQPLIQQVWDELAKPQPDQALIARLVDEATDNRHTYQKEMATVLTQFLAVLSPEQRAQFVALAKRQQDQRAAHIRRLIMP
jgi:Spy/CpxP family protein refolding chaperone